MTLKGLDNSILTGQEEAEDEKKQEQANRKMREQIEKLEAEHRREEEARQRLIRSGKGGIQQRLNNRR
jgi:hypothetical protein